MSTPIPPSDDHFTITRSEVGGARHGHPIEPVSTATFPGYEILHELHRGGQGIVYQAIQTGTQRKVALKILLEGPYASAAAKRRFEREVELVAQLKHPNIIAIFHSGQSTDGRQFYVMDYVRGVPLTQFVRDNELTLEETLKLFSTVCEAVQYAHQRGIIHRDLKPSNILVDTDGVPHVLDFGLAKWLAAPAETNVSVSAQVIGTLPYMSPEQARGNPDEIDTRTDVYALGVILYELLTGHYPYPVVGQIMEILRHITQTPATPPSKQWTPDSGVTKRSKGRFRKGHCPIDDEVQTIILKALSKERDRRYQSAQNLARDVDHYLAGEAIEAKRDSGWYVLRKTLRRYRLAVAAGTAFVLLLAGSAVVSTVLWRRAAAARSEAQAQKALAEGSARAERQRADELKQVSDFQQQMLSQIDATDAGVKLMQDIRERFAGALVKRGVGEKDREVQVQALGDELSRVNATDTAVAMIDRTILKPAFSAVNSQFKNQPVVNAALWQALADVYRKLGRFDDAMPPQEQALATRRRVLGPEHPDTLTSINNMGSLLQDQGKLVAAEPNYREALERRRRVLGNEHPETLTSITHMGQLLQAQGKLTEAELYYRDALEKSRRVLGTDHPNTLILISNMGSLLEAEGKLAAAEPYHREALTECRRVLGDVHPHTLVLINNMGVLLQAQGKLAEAEPYYREALERSRRVLGDEHSETLASISSMGSLLQAEGKLAEAEPYCREALEKYRGVLGDEHPHTLISLNNMGNLLQAQGKLKEAELYYHEALQKRRRVLGDEHPDTLRSVAHMGNVLSAQGKLAEAEPYYLDALEKTRRMLGDEHSETLASINNMGNLLSAQGKLAEAEPYYRDALERSRRVLGNEHPSTLTTIFNMSFLLRARGKLTEAEPYAREALEKRRRALGDEHPDTLISVGFMGLLLQAQGNHAEAIHLLVPAEPAARRVFNGTNGLKLGRFLTVLGRARVGMREFGAAETNLTEAQAITSASNAATQKHREEVLTGMVELYTAWHAAEPGNGHDKKADDWRAKLAECQASTQPTSQPYTQPTSSPSSSK